MKHVAVWYEENDNHGVDDPVCSVWASVCRQFQYFCSNGSYEALELASLHMPFPFCHFTYVKI